MCRVRPEHDIAGTALEAVRREIGTDGVARASPRRGHELRRTHRFHARRATHSESKVPATFHDEARVEAEVRGKVRHHLRLPPTLGPEPHNMVTPACRAALVRTRNRHLGAALGRPQPPLAPMRRNRARDRSRTCWPRSTPTQPASSGDDAGFPISVRPTPVLPCIRVAVRKKGRSRCLRSTTDRSGRRTAGMTYSGWLAATARKSSSSRPA